VWLAKEETTMTDKEIMNTVRSNPSLTNAREKAAAMYGVIATLAFLGHVERAKKLAEEFGVKF
jgi:hypothetical protein